MARKIARSKPGPRSLRVSDGFTSYVLDQLEELGGVTPRSMFGGVGLYHGGVFFGILARDVLYLKTDARNRPDYVRAGSKTFVPYLDKPWRSTRYYEVPLDVLESAPELAGWARKAIAAARAPASTRPAGRASTRRPPAGGRHRSRGDSRTRRP